MKNIKLTAKQLTLILDLTNDAIVEYNLSIKNSMGNGKDEKHPVIKNITKLIDELKELKNVFIKNEE